MANDAMTQWPMTQCPGNDQYPGDERGVRGLVIGGLVIHWALRHWPLDIYHPARAATLLTYEIWRGRI